MGEVYRADDLKLAQAVALKFLPERLASDSSWIERFYAEVRHARQVSHPSVCRVYDVGEIEGRHYLSMEYVDGEDLASLLRRIGRLGQDKALEIARQLCAGLAAAHDKGVLHRDLKPANIMIDGRGRARITDFGLAVGADEKHAEGEVSGTPAYMAPEQLAGRPATPQSDIYALGLVLYELFTGKKAFEATTLADWWLKHSQEPPPAPSTAVREMDPVIERVILRCLEKEPRERPRSVLSVAAALPGGDPLAAALAAGETPSPEMVAAAGEPGGMKPALAWSCLLGFCSAWSSRRFSRPGSRFTAGSRSRNLPTRSRRGRARSFAGSGTPKNRRIPRRFSRRILGTSITSKRTILLPWCRCSFWPAWRSMDSGPRLRAGPFSGR